VRNMPREIVGDTLLTKSYIPKVSETPEPEGPYHTELPTPKEIHRFLQFERIESDRIIKSKLVILSLNQVLTRQIRQDMKRWEDLIHENVFGLGGHRDHLPVCLAHMLYCLVAKQQYNLAYFFAKRIENARATPKANLPYGMFLTHLYLHIMDVYPHFDNDICNVVDQVMRPLVLVQTRKPRKDRRSQRPRHSTSSSSAYHRGSSSHQLNDDEDVQNEGTFRASTPSPTSYLTSLSPLTYHQYNIPTSS
ncbi:hypothetical protein Tco_0149893, partial [Tanacetum coccineum]